MASPLHNAGRRFYMSAFSNSLMEYSPQMEVFDPSAEMEFASSRGILSEDEEIELASELLDLQTEEELDQFLGDLVGKIGGLLGNVVRSPIGRAIGGALKNAAKKALPVVGGALGGIVGGPIGSMLGSNLASMAGGALGLELEGLSPEDREFQAAKQFCRFASKAIRNALEAQPNGDPAVAAHNAAVEAARVCAPGLINIGDDPRPNRNLPSSGRWVRHHGKIILFGVFG
jgi:hypothetical protein